MKSLFLSLQIIRPLFFLVLLAVQSFAGETDPVGKRVDGWPTAPYTRVVGYLFDSGGTGPDSLLPNGQLEQRRLEKLRQKEVTLDKAQVNRLLAATFASEQIQLPMRCYNPHHIFVFYDAQSKPVAAIEVCFACNNLASMPKKDTRFRHDFAALARLSVELSLGLGPSTGTLDEYLSQLKPKEDRR